MAGQLMRECVFMEKENMMDEKTEKHIRYIGMYLTVWILALVCTLFFFWPKPSTCFQPGLDPNTLGTQMSKDIGIDNDSNMPQEAGLPETAPKKADSSLTSTLANYPMSCSTIVGLVLIMGALGACLHGITSLSAHRGLRKFSADWTMWYLFRPLVGGVLALIFYLIISGGFIPQAQSSSKGFFAMLGMSGLIGLFSKQALNKLSLIFDAIFASDNEKDEGYRKPPQKPVEPPKPDALDEIETADTPETPAPQTPPEETQP
jgi:hypothetical protein